MARELPDSTACILHYKKLLELQSEMQPDDKSYSAALPLFGSIVSQPFDRKLKHNGCTDPVELKVADPKETSEFFLFLVLFPISFLKECWKVGAHSAREIGETPAGLRGEPRDYCRFLAGSQLWTHHLSTSACHRTPWGRVALHPNSAGNQAPQLGVLCLLFPGEIDLHHACSRCQLHRPLWIVSVPEVGVKPEAAEPNPRVDPTLEEMRMQASRLAKSWPPLPPEPGLPGASQLPGYGALASCAVEPHEGRIPPGGVVTIRVTLRAVHECDLDGQLVIDLPLNAECADPAAAPLKVCLLLTLVGPDISRYLDMCRIFF